MTTPGEPSPDQTTVESGANQVVDSTEAPEDDENLPAKAEEEEEELPYSQRFRDPGRGIFEGPRAVGPINQGPRSVQYSGLASLLYNASITQGIISADPFLSSTSSLISSTNPSSTIANADPNQALLESSQDLFANVTALEFVDDRERKEAQSEAEFRLDDYQSGDAAETVDELGQKVYDSVNSGGSS